MNGGVARRVALCRKQARMHDSSCRHAEARACKRGRELLTEGGQGSSMKGHASSCLLAAACLPPRRAPPTKGRPTCGCSASCWSRAAASADIVTSSKVGLRGADVEPGARRMQVPAGAPAARSFCRPPTCRQPRGCTAQAAAASQAAHPRPPAVTTMSCAADRARTSRQMASTSSRTTTTWRLQGRAAGRCGQGSGRRLLPCAPARRCAAAAAPASGGTRGPTPLCPARPRLAPPRAACPPHLVHAPADGAQLGAEEARVHVLHLRRGRPAHT